MNRALLWKELRMQRPVLLSGAALAMMAPLLAAGLLSVDGRSSAFDIVRSLPGLLATVWPFLAIAAGAITFATEAEDGTERFLLSRPVSRARVWWVKVGAGAGTLLTTVVLALVAVRVTATILGPPPSDYTMRPGLSDATMFSVAMLVGVGAMLFACGVLCSTLLARPLTAAAAAVALALAVIAIVLTIWSLLSLTPQLEPHWLGGEIGVVAAILLMVSLLVFTWPERSDNGASPGGNVARRLRMGGGALLVLSSVALPAFFAAVTPAPGDSTVVPGSIAHSGRAVVMTMRDQSGTTQNWMLMTDGTGVRPLTGRYTSAPRWAIGRALVTYYSQRGEFGGRDDALDLRLTDISGAQSWLVFPDMPGVRELFFRDGSHRGDVAFSSDNLLRVAKLNGYGHRTFDTSSPPLVGAVLLGFNNARSHNELVFVGGDVDASRGELRDPGALFVYDLGDGTTRELRKLEAGSVLQGRMRNRDERAEGARGGPAWGHIYLLAAEHRDNGTVGGRIERVNAAAGDPQLFLEIESLWSNEDGRGTFSRCSAVEPAQDRGWRSDDGRWHTEDQVLFADCSETARAQYPDGVIRLVGARTGHEVTWPLPRAWRGEIHRALLNQQQETVLLDIRGADSADSYAVTIDQSGDARTYPAGWTPLGWTTPDYFLLQHRDTADVAFAVGDARAGETWGLYPVNELREVLRQRVEQERLEAARAANAGR